MINTPVVSRSVTTVIFDNLPAHHMGRWMTESFPLIFRIKPPFDDKRIMLEVLPSLVICDKESRKELFRFQTCTSFQFEGKYSNEYTYGLIHHLFTIAIDDFNTKLKEHKSMLTIHRKFVKPSPNEVRQDIINAMQLNGYERTGIKPHWKKSKEDYEGADNDLLIAQLPAIPSFKQFLGPVTTEQEVLGRGYSSLPLTPEDEQVLKEAITFYEKCLPQLKSINLFSLTDEQAGRLILYLHQVFNVNMIISHEASFDWLFRVTPVLPEFLQNGKVRSTKWVRYPDPEIVKRRNVFNRASSPERTLFYASFFENAAIRETKPQAGDRFILSKWWNHSQQPFVAYPICLANEVGNFKVNEATYAFEMISEKLHPLVAQLGEIQLAFWSSEFIKDPEIINPRRYEYLYSAYFSDKMLEKFPEGSTMKDFDCMLYPSVAWEHKHDNLAIKPESVDQKLLLIEASEYEVLETFYDKRIPLAAMPARLRLIRRSVFVEKNRIKWNDD